VNLEIQLLVGLKIHILGFSRVRILVGLKIYIGFSRVRIFLSPI
jgi:hypothetical protein